MVYGALRELFMVKEQLDRTLRIFLREAFERLLSILLVNTFLVRVYVMMGSLGGVLIPPDGVREDGG